jgi:hypothetical protein
LIHKKLIHKWYVKARYQEDHEARAKILGCDAILEDTSSQVDPLNALPHLIVQNASGINSILEEPVSLNELSALIDKVTNLAGDDPIKLVLD